MVTRVRRAFKYRFHPTEAQAAELSRTFGCVRKVCNMAPAVRPEAWTLRAERVTYNATSAMLTAWKKTEELAYLNEVSSVPLQQALRHLQAGFTNFFGKRVKYPRFKSRKKSRKSAEYTTSVFRFHDGRLTLSTGEKIANPRHERRDRARLARAQRELSRKAPGDGANRAKARCKVARIHARIADRRRDHLHKITARLVRENQTIVIEDLTVRNLLKNGKLARAISDAAWSQFRSLLEYKARWYGRDVIAVDHWFPSSKLCSACGTLQDRMPLHVRTWTCDGCGITHDRDVNAAHNLLAAGPAVSACGAGVRPQRESSRTGQPVTKQETPRRKP
ncbi:RNA-guided endonuclease TnpB family protein [Streptomyces kebangsaanensis]|uniref:RNA-guided endonuclease TnpB family protein n=1 Tax=Streptomyces kebangsaanensis TaxID=864058 RepID=UPI00093D9575|nr:RNA-guided endonuclease TnpB family protein [Streptomyces kebangsaanensis]